MMLAEQPFISLPLDSALWIEPSCLLKVVGYGGEAAPRPDAHVAGDPRNPT